MQTAFSTDVDMDKDFKERPLSESSVSHKLADIQKRCSELLDEPAGLELTLDEPQPFIDSGNPYNRG